MLSAWDISLVLRSTTCGATEPGARPRFIASAMRWPMPVVVASRILVLLNSAVDFDRLAITAGTIIIAPKKIGPNTVAMMNQRVRTRSRYSRLMIAQSLAMAGHSHFNSRCPDSLEEDLVQGRTNYLEPAHRCAGPYNALEQDLRISAVSHLDLEVAIRIVDTTDKRAVVEHSGDAGGRRSSESKRNVA